MGGGDSAAEALLLTHLDWTGFLSNGNNTVFKFINYE
jgi:hypothetical protein